MLSVRDPERRVLSVTDTVVEMCHGESLLGSVSNARARIDAA